MAERVILHIGPRKTGTTYLQHTLWNNRPRLAEQGFFLPLPTPGQGAARKQAKALDPGGDAVWPNSSRLRRRLMREIRTEPGTAVVSAEHLSALTEAEIDQLFADLPKRPVDVVLAVRDLARQLPAAWQQSVRARSTTPYDVFLDRVRDDPEHPFWLSQHPLVVVERWQRAVPREAFRVVVLPATKSAPDELWRRFAGALGLDPDGFELPGSTVNNSLGVVQAELLREVNAALGEDRFPRPGSYAPVIRQHLTDSVLATAPDAHRLVLPESAHDWVSERQQSLVDELVASGLPLYGDPADLLVPPRPAARPMAATGDELLDEAVRTIVELLHRTELRRG